MNRAVRLAPEARPTLLVPVAVALMAVVAWGAVSAHEARTVAALTASWLFFAGASTGALATSALLELAGGDWAEPLHAVAVRLSRYLPIAAAILVVLALLVPRTRSLDGGAAVFFFAREVAGTLVLFAFGRYTLQGRPGARRGWVLVLYCVLFAVVGSMWAFDFVVAPNPGLNNTLAGPHLFVGAFMSGYGLSLIGALRAGTLSARQRRDGATLIVAFAVFWAYLFWSQLLTFRYSNLPDETAYLVRRMSGGWAVVTLLVVAATLVVPFGLLLGEWGRRSSRVVVVAVTSQLVGLWLERQLLVVPSTIGSAVPIDLSGALIQLAMAALFLSWTWPWTDRSAISAGSAPVAPPDVGAAAGR
jgi:Ni/Fe-hydrogenase subunit HybB-like protein